MSRSWSAPVRWSMGVAVMVLAGCGGQKEPPAKPSETLPAKTDKTIEPLKIPPTVAGPDHLDLIPANATGFVTIRVGDIWASDLATKLRAVLPKEALKDITEFEAKVGVPIGEVRRVSVIAYGDPKAGPPLGIVSTARPVTASSIKKLIGPEADEKTVDGLKVFSALSEKDVYVHLANENLFLVGKVPDIQKTLKKEGGSGVLGAAVAAAKEHHVVAAGDAAAVLKDVKKNVPPEAKQFGPLFEVQIATVTVDVTQDVMVNGSLRFPGDEAAQKGVKVLDGLVAIARLGLGTIGDAELEKKAGDVLDALSLKQQGDSVNLAFQAKGAEIVETVKAGVPKAQAAANRTTAQNNLKQIGLAMLNHESAYQTFPAAAISSADGKPLLSWRVAILPFIEQEELYKQFKLDEPWDSPANKKLIDKMPKIYALPGVTDPAGATHFRVFLGPMAAFEGNKGVSFRSFADGSSNTFLVVEAADAVPWTKPEELAFDAAKPLPKLGAQSPNGFSAVLGDGSVHFVKKTVSEKTLKALITRNAGDLPGQDWK